MTSRRARAAMGALGAALLTILWSPPAPPAHEERVVIGRVQVIDLTKKVLVVEDPERERTVRLTVDTDTEVRRCRHGLPLASVPAGARVRVKYLDRPGGGLETLSILMLPAAGDKGR